MSEETKPVLQEGLKKETVEPKSTIKTDIFGIELDLPVETAKALISKRDERSSIFKDLSEKVKKYESDLEDTRKRLDMAEKVKQGAYEEAEKIANQKLENKLQKYKNKVIESEISRNLLEHPEFIGSEALGDALQLIKSKINFDLADDDSIRAGDKTVKDAVSEFIKEKPLFRKVGSNKKIDARPNPIKEKKNPLETFSKALEKFIK